MKYKVYDGRDFLGECETITTLNDLLLKLKKSKNNICLILIYSVESTIPLVIILMFF